MHIETKAHNLVNLEGPALVGAIEKDFGLKITNPEKVIHGYSSQVFKAQLGAETVFIRINQKPQKFEREIFGYDAYKKAGIPAPDLVAYDRMPPTIGQPTIIISKVEGTAVGSMKLSPEQQDVIYERMGELMRKIHTIKLEGYGQIDTAGGSMKGKYKAWKEYYTSPELREKKSLNYLFSNKMISEEEFQAVIKADQEISNLDFGQASLLHKDLSGSHVFVTGDKITGVIDLEKMIAGDPRLDIATALVFQTPAQRASFKRGYGGELPNDPMVLRYLLSIAANKIAFRTKRGSNESSDKALRVFKETLDEINRQ